VHWFTGRLGEVLDGVLGPDGQAGLALSCLDPEQTIETVTEVDQAIARLIGLRAELLAHAETVEVAAHATPVSTSTPGWYAHATRTTRPVASRIVKQALRLATERALTGTALRAGSVDAAQARVIVDAVDALPPEVGPELRTEAERHLLDLALVHDADALKALAKHLHEVIDPDGAEEALARQLEAEEDAAYAAVRVTIRDNGRGRTRTIIDSPTLHGDILKCTLDVFMNPRRPCHQTSKHGTDAPLGEPGPGGQPGETGWVPDPTDDGRRISLAEARGRAFLELLETLPVGKLPKSGGSPLQVGVTMDLDALLGGMTPAILDTGHLISAGEARRLAARHGVIPVVLGSKSEVLDVGRKKRLHTRPMRTALRIQHQTCTVEGCTVPAAWCHAHHKTPWARGGGTSVHDGTLACGRHHRMIHSSLYRTTYGPDGTTYITRIRR
jgi:hypothetical protein